MGDRVPTGISGLDKMLGGGLLRGSVAVVKGAPGTGKSSFGIEFLARGIVDQSEVGLYVTFEEFGEQLYRDAASLGFDFEKFTADGKLKLLFPSPAIFLEMLQKPGGEFDKLMLENGVSRIVIDSVNNVMNALCPDDCRDFLYFFINGLRRHRATTMLVQEDHSLMGDCQMEAHGLCFMADTLIQLKYVEIKSALERAVFVVKQRATKHDNKIHSFKITDRGIVIGAPFDGKEGVLSGSPRDTTQCT